MEDEWCFRLSRYSKFLFRRWLTSMFTSVSFWKIAAMLVQSSTSFRRGGWGVSSLILCTHRDSVSKMALLWVFLFRPWLTIFLFWNIALTFKLRQVPPRYSGLQSLLSCPHGVVIHARWERMAWRNWYDERWEGWNGGKGMRGVKRSWSGTAIVPRDNENNSHTESMCQRSNETFAILSASIRTFYEWIIFSALKKLMDIRWIANIGSSAWELSWLETSSPQFTEKTIAIRSMYRGIFQYRDVPVF